MNATVCYVSPDAPSFSMRVEVDGKDRRIKFANKELRLDAEKDAALIAVLDELIATRPNISSIIRKVDMKAAEALARAHMQQLQRHRGTVKGPVSADDAKRAASMAVEERDADLASQGATTADIASMRDAMSKDGLELTENAKGVIAPETRDGFTPAVIPKSPVDDAAENVADPKSIFANLGTK